VPTQSPGTDEASHRTAADGWQPRPKIAPPGCPCSTTAWASGRCAPHLVRSFTFSGPSSCRRLNRRP